MCLGLRICTLRFSRDHLSNIERLSQEAARDIFVSYGIGDQTPLVSRRAAAPVELRLIALERMDVITVEGAAGLWRCREIRLESSLFVALGNKKEKNRNESEGSQWNDRTCYRIHDRNKTLLGEKESVLSFTDRLAERYEPEDCWRAAQYDRDFVLLLLHADFQSIV